MKKIRVLVRTAAIAAVALTIGMFVAGPEFARAEQLKDFVIDEA